MGTIALLSLYLLAVLDIIFIKDIRIVAGFVWILKKYITLKILLSFFLKRYLIRTKLKLLTNWIMWSLYFSSIVIWTWVWSYPRKLSYAGKYLIARLLWWINLFISPFVKLSAKCTANSTKSAKFIAAAQSPRLLRLRALFLKLKIDNKFGVFSFTCQLWRPISGYLKCISGHWRYSHSTQPYLRSFECFRPSIRRFLKRICQLRLRILCLQ